MSTTPFVGSTGTIGSAFGSSLSSAATGAFICAFTLPFCTLKVSFFTTVPLLSISSVSVPFAPLSAPETTKTATTFAFSPMAPRQPSRSGFFKQFSAGEPGPAIFTVRFTAPKGSIRSSAKTRAFSSTGMRRTEAALAESGIIRQHTSQRMGNPSEAELGASEHSYSGLVIPGPVAAL